MPLLGTPTYTRPAAAHSPGRGWRSARRRLKRLFQHVFIEEQHRRQRLVLRGRSHAFVNCQMYREPVEVLLCELARMSAVVKPEEAVNPVEVSLLSAPAVISAAQSFTHAIVEPRCQLTRT
jgi:hypothetical protein